MTQTIRLLGADIRVLAPPTRAISLWFGFEPVDISTWTWAGTVRRSSDSVVVVQSFAFSSPEATAVLATLSAGQVEALAALDEVWYYEISRLSPDPRQMFYGMLVLGTQESC